MNFTPTKSPSNTACKTPEFGCTTTEHGKETPHFAYCQGTPDNKPVTNRQPGAPRKLRIAAFTV